MSSTNMCSMLSEACDSDTRSYHPDVEIAEIVARLEQANREHTPVLAVRDVLDELVADPPRLAEALGPVEQGGITPLHHTDELTVLHVVWTPGMRLYPHEHNMWAAIGMYGGIEDNAFFRRTPQGLQPSGGKELPEGDVLVMGDDVIHSVANTRRRYATALHVYGGDFFGADGRSEWDADTLEERPRDMQRTARLFDEANARWVAAGETA
jgi:predicted metal-dependent enzyme (double-stranded beta helix superfamily)